MPSPAAAATFADKIIRGRVCPRISLCTYESPSWRNGPAALAVRPYWLPNDPGHLLTSSSSPFTDLVHFIDLRPSCEVQRANAISNQDYIGYMDTNRFEEE